MSATRRLHLVVPGLLGPVTDVDAVARIRPELVSLAHLLSRADVGHDAPADAYSAIFAEFGIDGGPLPIAAASRAGEADGADVELDSYWWLRVDPVHLRVDTTKARLFGGYALGLEVDEAAALIARLNDFFAADGLELAAPAPDRWYLALERAPTIETHPLEAVAGRNVNPFLPTGADAPAWRSWLNEVQMLLHDAPVNAERAARGALPVNSVWPWGGGRAPAIGHAPARVWSTDPVAVGLARRARTDAVMVPGQLDACHLADGTNLAVTGAVCEPLVHGDVEVWLERLARLERDWLGPLLQGLEEGALGAVRILPADGRRFSLTRWRLRRFWRRGRSWTHWLVAEP